jgi:hypothetical protein
MATFRLDGSDMHALVRKGLGNPSTAEVSPAFIMQVINLSSLEIVKARPKAFPCLNATETLTTVATEAEIELVTTDVVMIRFIASSWIPRLDREDADYAARSGATLSPQPYQWYPAGGDNDGVWVIGLIGTPTQSGKTLVAHLTVCPRTIVYEPDTPELTNTSVLPQSYDLPIVQKAIKIGLALSGRRTDAGKQQKLDGETEARARRSDPGGIEHTWPIGGSMPKVGRS